jgi:beta-N-acetylhexosaminidase
MGRRRKILVAVAVGLTTCLLFGSLLLVRQLTAAPGRLSANPLVTPSGAIEKPPTPAASTGGAAASLPRQDLDDRLTLSQLVGQMVISGIDGTKADASTLRAVREGEMGGVLLFSRDVSGGLPGEVQRLQESAAAGGNPPLFVATDQEGGTVKRLPGPPKSPRLMASENDARSEGEATAALLISSHINVNFAPVADVAAAQGFEAAQGRGFAGDPHRVAALADAFAQGLQSGGVAATAKHFPGVGSLSVDTDTVLGRVGASEAELEEQLIPFRQLSQDGVDMVMLANAVYAGWDPEKPAVFSSKVIGQLRQKVGFQGVVITDDLNAASLSGDVGTRAVEAVAAGADIALYGSPGAGQAAYAALLAAAESGRLPRSRLLQSHERLIALKAKLTTPAPSRAG